MTKKTFKNLTKKVDIPFFNNYNYGCNEVTAEKYLDLYAVVQKDIIKSFGIIIPPAYVKPVLENREDAYVIFGWSGTDYANRSPIRVVFSESAHCTAEYTVIHEVAHIVEHYFSGSTSNKHGKKFHKFMDALLERYGIEQEVRLYRFENFIAYCNYSRFM